MMPRVSRKVRGQNSQLKGRTHSIRAKQRSRTRDSANPASALEKVNGMKIIRVRNRRSNDTTEELREDENWYFFPLKAAESGE